MEKMARFTLISLIILYLGGWSCLAAAQEASSEEPQRPIAQKLIPMGNISVLGSYSKVCGGNNLSGLYASTYLAPAIKLSPEDYFIPLYSGLYKKQRQIVSEEEGGRLYTTVMSHNFSLMHKHLYSDLLTQRISAFCSLNYNKETSDESFGDGLYDYRDYGLNFDYQHKLVKIKDMTGTLLVGGKYYFREYPNFKSLISLASQTAPEEDEKNQNVWGLSSRYTHKLTDKLIASISYDYLFKHFTDKYIIDLNGILTDERREDNVHFFKLNTEYKINKNLIFNLDGEVELNNSNQNYYDSKNTNSLLDDDFIPHYFDYNKYKISPSLIYFLPLKENKNAIFEIAYAYTEREYTNRNAKDAQGTYQSYAQKDYIHGAFLNITYPLTAKFSLLFKGDYIHNISNMEYERYYRYDYDIFHILSGLSYKF